MNLIELTHKNDIVSVVPNYDPFGETEISVEEWNEIGKVILTKDNESQQIFNEADRWLQKVFEDYNCFTILGT